MSRYVDLYGPSWDGKPIASKIQEVETKYGYMQGITVGWLWGDNVPHIDLEEHDAKVRQDAIEDFVGRILSNGTLKSTGEMVLEIRMDIFNFIVNNLKGE